MATPSTGSQHFRFLDLPPELRDEIYAFALAPKLHEEENYSLRKYRLALLRVNKQIHSEAWEIFRKDNVFCRIETPWQETQHRVAVEGHVPLVATGRDAAIFSYHHLSIQIDHPHYPRRNPTTNIVFLVDDLHLFTNMWFLADLSLPQLNTHFRLTLKLRNPHVTSFADPMLSKSLQQRLLLPFGAVKNLGELYIIGPHYPSVEKALRETMTIPVKTPEVCLEEAHTLKDQGNALLQQGKYRDAIAKYEASFAAIFILCKGRRRDIWAEAHFQTTLTSGTFKDQNGGLVCMTLRVRLVANICQAYLKLREYEETQFWGMRTIKMIRIAMLGDGEGNMEDDEVFVQIPAAAEVGKIYYRTGIATRELGDPDEARRLLRVAEKYLPNDPQVKRDLATVAPRLL